MLSLLFIFCLLFSPNLGAYYITTLYSEEKCTGTIITSNIMECDVCISVGSTSAKISCSGSSISSSSCSDSACGNCETSPLVDVTGCMGAGLQISVSSNFPSVSSYTNVLIGYQDVSCNSKPFLWILNNMQTTCSTVNNGACISNQAATSTSGNTQIPYLGFRYQCGSSFQPPSSSGGVSPTSTPTQPPDCTITAGSCSFYENCVQRSVPCSSSDYAIGYGSKYCNLYMNRISEFSSEGQEWVENVLVCLQETLTTIVQTNPRPSCATIRNTAFESHPFCYLNNNNNSSSVCFLPSDWPLIMNIVGKALFTTTEGFNQAAVTAGGCMEAYKMSAVYKFSNFVSSTSETLDSLLTKLSNLIGIAKNRISIIDSSSSTFNYFSAGNTRRAAGDYNSSITFVFYADTQEEVQAYDVQVVEILQNQTIWPTATVQTCSGTNTTSCKSSNEVIGPSPANPTTSASATTTSSDSSSLYSLFSLFSVAFVVVASFAVAL